MLFLISVSIYVLLFASSAVLILLDTDGSPFKKALKVFSVCLIVIVVITLSYLTEFASVIFHYQEYESAAYEFSDFNEELIIRANEFLGDHGIYDNFCSDINLIIVKYSEYDIGSIYTDDELERYNTLKDKADEYNFFRVSFYPLIK